MFLLWYLWGVACDIHGSYIEGLVGCIWLRRVLSYPVHAYLLLRKLFRLYLIRLLNKELSCLVGTSDDFNLRTKLPYWKIVSDAISVDFCKHHVSSLLF